MEDMMGDAIDFLNQELACFASQGLTIRNGADEISIAVLIEGEQRPLVTMLGSSPGSIDLGEASPANQVYAFSVLATDLDFGAGPVEPSEGTMILWPVNGVTYQCTVMQPGDGPKAWESIARRTRWLLRTQITGIEP